MDVCIKMSLTTLILGLLIILSSNFIPNSACSMHDRITLPKDVCEYKSRNWLIRYLIMILGALVVIIGEFIIPNH